LNIFEALKFINWRPGIGDPILIGWTITLAYFIIAFLCWLTGLAEKKNIPNTRRAEVYILWFGLAALLFVLGLNKQLDFQTLLTSLGREIAKANGWYDIRREVQRVFIILIATFSFLSLSAMIWWLRSYSRKYWLILLGLSIIIIFVVIRAASFNHVDYLLSKWRIIGPFKMKYVVELGGILILGAGVVQNLYRVRAKCAARGEVLDIL